MTASLYLLIGFFALAATVWVTQAQCNIGTCDKLVKNNYAKTFNCTTVTAAVRCLQTISSSGACDLGTKITANVHVNIIKGFNARCSQKGYKDAVVSGNCDLNVCEKKVITDQGLTVFCRTTKESVACLQDVSKNYACDMSAQINAKVHGEIETVGNGRCFRVGKCPSELLDNHRLTINNTIFCNRTCTAPSTRNSSKQETCKSLREFQECNYRGFDNFGPCLSFDVYYINDIFARIQCTQDKMRAAGCRDVCELKCLAPDIYSDKSAKTCKAITDNIACLKTSMINKPSCPDAYKTSVQSLVERYRTLVPGCQGV